MTTPDAVAPVPAGPLPVERAGFAPPDAGRTDRRRGAVPAAYTAIEGTYAQVARAPWWRRVLSLAAIVLIAVAAGAGIAGIAAAIIGAASEVVTNTIG